ncbi:MAG: septation ring formation regulator EzrA, partial [Muribaculaceae bacterium]|nr:septation ring formation regulator EzrA [Muribaculaceae bacterium]
MRKPCTYFIIILTALLAACSDARTESASAELTRAEEAFSESDYASAMNIAASALDLPQPDSIVCARLYDIIARCHRNAGNAEAELSYAQQAAEWAPNDSLV